MKRVFLATLACSVAWQVYSYNRPIQPTAQKRSVRAWQRAEGEGKATPLPPLHMVTERTPDANADKAGSVKVARFVSTLDQRIRRADKIKASAGLSVDLSRPTYSGAILLPHSNKGRSRPATMRPRNR
jgi:hypothetical protein